MASAPVTPRKVPLVPNSLKVAELRAELSARNLSPKGLKKDLVKRLASALGQEPAGGAEAVACGRSADVENEEEEREEAESPKDDASAKADGSVEENAVEGHDAAESNAEGRPVSSAAKEAAEESPKGVAEQPAPTPETTSVAGDAQAPEVQAMTEHEVSEKPELNSDKQRKADVHPPPSRSPFPAKPLETKEQAAVEKAHGRRSRTKQEPAVSSQRTPSPVKEEIAAATQDATELSADDQHIPTAQPAAADAMRKRGRNLGPATADVVHNEGPRGEVAAEPSAKRRRAVEEMSADVEMTDVAAASSPSKQQQLESASNAAGISNSEDSKAVAEPEEAVEIQKAVPENADALTEVAPKKKRSFSPIKPPSPVRPSLPPPLAAKPAHPADTSPGPSPVQSDRQEVVNTEQVSSPRFAVSSSIFILGLHRPFTNPALKRMLEESGTVEFFWIDNIKSHCYVTFADVESAKTARSQLHSTVWPSQTGHRLTVDFITAERMRALIEEEEKEQRARRRVRVVESADPDVVLVVEDISTVGPRSVPFGSAAALPSPSMVTSNAEGVRRPSSGILSRLGGLAAAPLSSLSSAKALPTLELENDLQTRQRDAAGSWKLSAAQENSAPAVEAPMPKQVPPDQIFQKTVTKPQLYYLLLTDKQVAEKRRSRETARADLPLSPG